MIQLELLAGVALFILVLHLHIRRRKNYIGRGLPLPPGPKGLPLIGNLLDMPKDFEWETYHQWCKEFSTRSYSSWIIGVA